ncbi:MAG: hypothetical protein AB7U61_00090 [Methylocystis sp.]
MRPYLPGDARSLLRRLELFIWSDRPPCVCISGISCKKEGAPGRFGGALIVLRERRAFLGVYVANVTGGVGDVAMTG